MIDITMVIQGSMKVYKNKKENKPVFKHVTSGHVYQSQISLDLHTGTHIDFPLHMIPNGKTSDDYSIDQFVGKCYVKDCTYVDEHILKKDLQAIHLESYDFIIFKTRNSMTEVFSEKFVYLEAEAAEYLSKFSLKGVGIDGLGIERAQEGHPTHVSLLSNDILIYEGLDLSQVTEGVYEFIALPMKTKHTEASLVRAMLR